MEKLLATACAVLTLGGCATLASAPEEFIPAGSPRTFLSPTPAIKTTIYSSGAPVDRYWASFTQDEIRSLLSLPIERVTVEQIATNGSASLLPASGSFSRGVYRVTYYYYRSRSEPCPNAAAGNLFSGIGIRMTADVTTTKGGVSLSNLMGLAAAVDRNHARGDLTIEAFGVASGSASITPYLQASSGLTVEGLRKAIESFGVIKAIIDTPSVQLTPYYVYVEGPTPATCMVAQS